MDPFTATLLIVGLALSAGGLAYGIVSNEEGKADAKKVAKKQNIEQQLANAVKQNAYNKQQAQAAQTQVAALRGALSETTAPKKTDYTPAIIAGIGLFLFLRRKK